MLFAVVSWSSLIVAAAITSTAVPNWFDEGDDLFRDVDESLTTLAGLGVNALVAALVGCAVISLGGLWAAGHLRRLTGRRLGAVGAEPSATGGPT